MTWGIKTLEDIRLRCFVDPETDCWLWRLSAQAGVPRVSMFWEGEERKFRGRRASWLMAGRPLPKGHVVYAKLCCQELLCMNPDHAQAGTRKQHGLWLRRSGLIKGLPKKIAAARASATARRKLTAERVLAIRAGGKSDYAFADEFGVSQFAVWSARTFRSWKHVRAPASVFSWRP